MRPGDRLITALVGPHEVGEQFDEWRLHVTIVAWFRSDVPSDELARQLEQNLKGIEPFEVLLGKEAHFGYKGKALVNLVVQPTPLTDVQRSAVATLDQLNADIFTGRGSWNGAYKPHMTEQGSDRMYEGDSFVCDHLYIVRKGEGTNKIIDAEVPLHG